MGYEFLSLRMVLSRRNQGNEITSILYISHWKQNSQYHDSITSKQYSDKNKYMHADKQ